MPIWFASKPYWHGFEVKNMDILTYYLEVNDIEILTWIMTYHKNKLLLKISSVVLEYADLKMNRTCRHD